MNKRIVLFSMILGISNMVLSQDSDSNVKPATIISGSVDAYYRFDFNNPKTVPYNSFTSFTRSNNSFELGMASLRADHNFGKVSATIDLGFGNRAEEFAYNDANTKLALKQLYVTYSPIAAVKLTLGTWGTHVGYELVDAYLNRNYSMSYMFTNGPFTHTGLKVAISLGDKSAFMVGLSNPTDYRSAPAMPKSFIAQFSTGSKDDKLKVYFNFVGGKQNDYKKIAQADVVATYAVSGTFSMGINGTMQSAKIDADSSGKFSKNSWDGIAVYLNMDPVSWFGLTLRTEYIGDNDQYLGLKNVIAPTLSANFKVDHLTIIPEFRFDHAGNAVFYKSASQSVTSASSFVLAATYHF